jgi:ubiquinone/menaquinone biosynthesis C-methylase UbiE
MHSTFLGLKPGMKIVDVGCGTGDFTRYLASLVPGKCKIIGVDIRATNIRTAEKQTKKKEWQTGSLSARATHTIFPLKTAGQILYVAEHC